MMTREALLDRLAAAARGSDDAMVRGDHDLDRLVPPPPYRYAAVLVPIVDRPEGLTVLLTKRTDHLSDHAGQISFPGGRIEPEDATAEDAALREAHEEIGLERDRVRLLGRLNRYHTTTGFEITPVVGLVKPGFILKPDPHEVAEVFEVSLDFLMDPKSLEQHSREWRGGQRSYYVFPYPDRYIWGATAGMLVNLVQVLTQPA